MCASTLHASYVMWLAIVSRELPGDISCLVWFMKNRRYKVIPTVWQFALFGGKLWGVEFFVRFLYVLVFLYQFFCLFVCCKPRHLDKIKSSDTVWTLRKSVVTFDQFERFTCAPLTLICRRIISALDISLKVIQWFMLKTCIILILLFRVTCDPLAE